MGQQGREVGTVRLIRTEFHNDPTPAPFHVIGAVLGAAHESRKFVVLANRHQDKHGSILT